MLQSIKSMCAGITTWGWMKLGSEYIDATFVSRFGASQVRPSWRRGNFGQAAGIGYRGREGSHKAV